MSATTRQSQNTRRGPGPDENAVQVIIPKGVNEAWAQTASLRGCSKAEVLIDLIPNALDAEILRITRERNLTTYQAAQ